MAIYIKIKAKMKSLIHPNHVIYFWKAGGSRASNGGQHFSNYLTREIQASHWPLQLFHWKVSTPCCLALVACIHLICWAGKMQVDIFQVVKLYAADGIAWHAPGCICCCCRHLQWGGDKPNRKQVYGPRHMYVSRGLGRVATLGSSITLTSTLRWYLDKKRHHRCM